MGTPADLPPALQHAPSVDVDLPITLGQFVKLAGLAATGGDAKRLVTAGLVRVNDQVEKRRGHKLAVGDFVEVLGATAQVAVRAGATQPPSARG